MDKHAPEKSVRKRERFRTDRSETIASSSFFDILSLVSPASISHYALTRNHSNARFKRQRATRTRSPFRTVENSLLVNDSVLFVPKDKSTLVTQGTIILSALKGHYFIRPLRTLKHIESSKGTPHMHACEGRGLARHGFPRPCEQPATRLAGASIQTVMLLHKDTFAHLYFEELTPEAF